MPLYSWLLSSLLVSQIGGNSPVPVTVAPVTVAPPTTVPREPAVPTATYPGTPAIGGDAIREPAAALGRDAIPSHTTPAAPRRATTPQLVADALTLPPGGTISGQPVRLASVVATAPDRPRQIEAVHAYWRLAEAVGEYHFAHEHQQRLAQLQAGNNEATDLRTARAIAEAQMREAEVQVTAAQHDLAEILLLVPGTPLPLPADQPLVGPYRTLFAELFAGKSAPQRARTLDQTLPLRNRAVESHAAALLAAEDVLDAAIELQPSGQEHLAGVLSALDAQGRQQRAFLAAVCRYNHDIADYALVVVSPQTTPELLVGTLIKQNRPAGQLVAPLPTTAPLPAAYQQPLVAPAVPAFHSLGVPQVSGSVGILPAIPNWPTRALRPGTMAGQALEAATAVRAEEAAPVSSPGSAGTPPAPSSVGVPPASPVVAPPNPLQNDELQEPHLAPPQESAIPLVPEKPTNSTSPPTDGKTTQGPAIHSSQKPISTSGSPQASALETYPGLVGLTPAERTTKLTTALYWIRNLPSSAGQPLNLIDCLRATPANSRAKAIETYWIARQIAARYQSLVEQIQWLESLGLTLSAENPPSPMAMLKLRTARLSVEAERTDAEADWNVAQFELVGLAGLGAEKIKPNSIPFVGRLPLPASSGSVGILPASSARSWSLRRLEATIPQRQQAIIDQAEVVVDADASRAAATADFLAGRSLVERVLAGIEVQARETSAFLRGVTEYNRAIAQYAIATLSTNTEAEKLVAALMVQ